MLEWQEQYQSICNAPLRPIDPFTLDDDHPALQFLTYWKSLNDGQTPSRSDFKPQDIPTLLRWLMMFRREVSDGSDLYFMYLQGDSAASLTDGLHQGQYLHEFTEEVCFDTRRQVMRGVLETGRPNFASIEVGAKKADYITTISVGAFPFLVENGEPEVVMVPAPTSMKLRAFL